MKARRQFVFLLPMVSLAFLSIGCRQDMTNRNPLSPEELMYRELVPEWAVNPDLLDPNFTPGAIDDLVTFYTATDIYKLKTWRCVDWVTARRRFMIGCEEYKEVIDADTGKKYYICVRPKYKEVSHNHCRKWELR